MNAIDVKDLRKSYKKVEVLKGVSFEVEPGNIYALLGANGAGKTTIINILTTLLVADSGIAAVDGRDVVKQATDVRSRISLTGQFAAVDDVLTARENLVLIAELRHVDDPDNVAEALLKQFDLVDAADRRTATFSGGMRRRLDIAMSLIGSPSVIFLDEPTTGLDPQSRNMMWETIKSLAVNGTTVFLTTQYLDEADKLADRIAILSRGVIVAEGTPRELKKLLPHGQIELRFADAAELQKAVKLLGRHVVSHDEETLALSISTDGSMGQVAEVFTRVQSANIDVVEFSQKVPTLDDAFLKIINEHEETK